MSSGNIHSKETISAQTSQVEKSSGLRTILLVTLASISIGASAYAIIRQTSQPRDGEGETRLDRQYRHYAVSHKITAQILARDEKPSTIGDYAYYADEDPKVTKAGEAKMSSDEPVIGVLQGGQARAYAISAMNDDGAVLHDKVGGTPLTISYCPSAKTARVFLRSIPSSDIRFWIRGGRLVLYVGGKEWPQSSKDVPLRDHEQFHVTTWGEWRAEHSASSLYTGE